MPELRLERLDASGASQGAASSLLRAALPLADQLALQVRRSRAAGVRLGPHVYDGAAGIALFLGACEAAAGAGRWRETCLGLLAPVRQELTRRVADDESAAGPALALGGLMGLGGFVYVFTRLSRWLDEPDLLRDAQAISALFTPERIAADDRLDVMSGSAGAILGLLALDGELGAEAAATDRRFAPLDRALACGEHLLARRIASDGLPPAWPGPQGRPPLTGFSHGAAGIAYALLRLAERTGRDDLRQAALEGFEFERRLYDADAGTWLDPRSGRPLEQSAWCHGAPGVALGRIAGLAGAEDERVQADIDLALEATRALPFAARDHLCCGNLGRADVLLEASRAGTSAAAADEARAVALAERVLLRAEETGGFALETVELGGGATILDPTLFRGTAGVGYAFLRLARPDALPSVLALS